MEKLTDSLRLPIKKEKSTTTEKPMDMIPTLPAPRATTTLPDYMKSDARLRDAANQLEATFLAEMLKSAGVGAPRESFGGGAGEDQFASFLREGQAQKMVEAGGIGLAESLFEAMKERLHGR